MFLVEKKNSSHFISFTTKHNKKPIIPNPKHSQSFDDHIISHLKTLTLPSNSLVITLTWMTNAVNFLTAIHSDHLCTRSESDSSYYMDYTLKVLDLCNLMTSSLKEMTEVKMLLKMSVRLLLTSSPEKMTKGKDALARAVLIKSRADEKKSRAVNLINEITSGLKQVQIGSGSGRILTGLGSLTVVIFNVLISVLYGTELTQSKFRVSTEFAFADSVNSVQSKLVDQIVISELDDIKKLSLILCDVIDDVIKGSEDKKVEYDNGVKELGEKVVKFSEGVEELTNGVDCLFRCVMKTRNGVLDGVRKSVW